MISESKPSYKESSVIAEMVKVADTPCPKGKQVSWEGNGPSSEEVVFLPEQRWDLNQLQVIGSERGKPHGLSLVQRVSKAQAMTNAQEVAESGESKCFVVMTKIGTMPASKDG
jgi:hypothetical protein